MTDSRAAPEPVAGPGYRPGGHRDEPEVVVLGTGADVSAEAAVRIVTALARAIEVRGRADFVTTGGSTPAGIYGVLAASFGDALDWTRVHVWWGDDRFVPRDHPLSNVRPADAILFAQPDAADGGDVRGLAIPTDYVHPFPCGEAIAGAHGAAWCARRYEAELRASGLRESRGFPVFDVILLGIGPDGHLLSVFPGSSTFDRLDWAMAVPAPTHVEPHVERVTLNPGVLAVAGSVLMVAIGAWKAAVVGEVFRTERDVRRLPAQLVRRSGVTWILDREAAANLPAHLAGEAAITIGG